MVCSWRTAYEHYGYKGWAVLLYSNMNVKL